MTSVANQINHPGIGFVGLGDMGAPMAGNLAANLPTAAKELGHGTLSLSVFDINLLAERVPESAATVDSLAAIAGSSEIVFMSVPDGDSSLAVIKELLAAADSRVQCVINLSTVGLQACKQITDLIPPGTIDYIDAPVSGGKTGATNATITVMWSGSEARFEQLQPLLTSFAKSVFFVGENPGQGQALKLLNNFLSGVAMTATSEAVRFGLHHGLDLKTLLDVVHVSTGQNTAISDKFPKRVLTETYDAGFRLALMQKDVALYQQGVEEAGLPSNIVEVVSRYWTDGREQFPDGDFTEIFKFITPDS